MVIAVSNAVALYANEEATWGEVPATPDMQQLRFTSETLTFKKMTVQSATIRSDRMRDQVALVGFDTNGDFGFELAGFDYDPFLEGGLFGTWAGIKTVTATTLAFTSTAITDSGNGLGAIPVNAYIWVSGATNPALNRRYRVTVSTAGSLTLNPAPVATLSAGPTITISASAMTVITNTTVLTATVSASGKTLTFAGSGGFDPTTMGIVAGQWIRTAGFAQAANNGLHRVASVTSTVITFANSDTLADETVTSATTLKFVGRRLRNGITQRSYHVQKAFSDINQFMSMRGMRVSGLKLVATAATIITGTVTFMGKQVLRAGTTYATTTQATNVSPVMTAAAHIGTIYQNGTPIAAGIKSIEIDVNNNLRNSTQIGSLYPYAVGYGFQDVTGKVEVFFEDATLYDQLINHTATELSFPVTDDLGSTYVITIPSVLFTDGYPLASGGNADVMLPLTFSAIRNPTYNCQIQIDELATLT